MERNELIESSYRDLTGLRGKLLDRLIERLLAREPSIGRLLPADEEGQRRLLAAALELVARNARDLDAIEGALLELGERHVRYGVGPNHFAIFIDELIGAMQDVLGDRWSPRLAEAWTSALNDVTEVMGRAATNSAGVGFES